MQELSINMLESYLREHYGDTGNEQSLFMKLVEEMGEVAELLNIRAGRKAGDACSDNELAEELADVIHYAVAIASINNIDLAASILEKDQRAAKKYNHSINLTDYMKG